MLFFPIPVVTIVTCLILWIYIGVNVESQRGMLVMVIMYCCLVWFSFVDTCDSNWQSNRDVLIVVSLILSVISLLLSAMFLLLLILWSIRRRKKVAKCTETAKCIFWHLRFMLGYWYFGPDVSALCVKVVLFSACMRLNIINCFAC